MKNKKTPENTEGISESRSIAEGEFSDPAEAERIKKHKARAVKKLNRVFDRIFGFGLVTVLAVMICAFGVLQILQNGPSENLSGLITRSILETRRFDFVAHLFMTDSQLNEISKEETQADTLEVSEIEFDDSLITIAETKTDESGMDAYGLVDDDGDGIIFETGTYHGSTYYMIIVLDPTRVFLGMPDSFGGYGLTLEDFVDKYDAIGGINAGGFVDANGAGNGGLPNGITIVDYECYNDFENGATVGIDGDGLMYIGYYSYEMCQQFGLKYACSFQPIIIINGEKVDEDSLESGINPRTAIGQRADGAIVMMVVDGRQAYSIGVSFSDCADIMLNYGVVNAINMDGGSSTCMMYEGELVNHPTNQAGGTRYLPDAWLVK